MKKQKPIALPAQVDHNIRINVVEPNKIALYTAIIEINKYVLEQLKPQPLQVTFGGNTNVNGSLTIQGHTTLDCNKHAIGSTINLNGFGDKESK